MGQAGNGGLVRHRVVGWVLRSIFSGIHAMQEGQSPDTLASPLVMVVVVRQPETQWNCETLGRQ